MIPAYQLLLLSHNKVEEFSFVYNEREHIIIEGKRISGKWSLHIRVITSLFSWGVNNFEEALSNSTQIIRKYLTIVINEITSYPTKYKVDHLIKLLRSV